MTGLIIDGGSGEIGGDHGTGGSRHHHFDYSREALPGWAGNVLDEAQLDASVGLQGSPAMDRYGTYYYTYYHTPDGSEVVEKVQVQNVNDPIEWDLYESLDAPFSMNVSHLDGITALKGHDDWSNLSYTGGRVGGGIIIALPVATPADELTAEEAVEQVQTPVAVVGNLRGHVADKMLHLTWKPVGPGVTYRVYRREDGGGPALVGTTTQTNFKDRDVKKGVVYTYTVKTYDPVHDTESAVAEAVSLQLRE
jgi:fibronectin type 3 domain-containing protein